MNARRLIHWICVLLVLSATATVVQAQTLADAARQERERRREVESKTRGNIPVMTNASIAAAAGAAVSTIITTATTVEETTPKTKGPTDQQGHDETYWRTKFDAARMDLQRADENLKLLDLKVNDLSNRLLAEGRYTEEVTLREQLETAQRDQTVARMVLADAQQKIPDLEDELRKAGGPPGWSRPK